MQNNTDEIYIYFLKKYFLNYLFKYNLYKGTAKIVCIDLVYLHLNNTFISPLNIITKNIDDTNTKDPSNANFCIYIYIWTENIAPKIKT